MRYIPSLILCFTVVAMLPFIANAQNKADKQELPEIDNTFVSFQLESEVKLPDQQAMQLPTEISEYLNNQAPLAMMKIDIFNHRNMAWLRTSYVFSDMNAYQEWRNTAQTKEFIKTLQNYSKENALKMNITMRRQPIDQIVDYNTKN